MTVTELREALQKLEAEGQGQLDVFFDDREDGHTPVLEVNVAQLEHFGARTGEVIARIS